MGLNIKWDITYKCNLNCSHCINGNLLGLTENELITEEVFHVIDRLSEAKVKYVHLLGGEPTARKDIIDILKYFDYKNIDFGFNTNGLKFKDEALISEVARNKHIKNIIFSIEGPNKEVNDSIRGKNVFDVTVSNLKSLIDLKRKHNLSNLKLTINTVLSRVNMPYLNEMIDFCIDLGVDELVLLQFIPGGNAKDSKAALTFNDELKCIEVVANRYKEVKDRLNIVPKFTRSVAKDYAQKILKLDFPEVYSSCGAGTSFAYINNNGELYPCDRYKDEILSKNDVEDIKLPHKDIFDIFMNPGYEELFEITEGKDFYKDISPCNKCKYLRKTCYPCPMTIDKGHNPVVNNCMGMLELIKGESGEN